MVKGADDLRIEFKAEDARGPIVRHGHPARWTSFADSRPGVGFLAGPGSRIAAPVGKERQLADDSAASRALHLACGAHVVRKVRSAFRRAGGFRQAASVSTASTM